MKAGDTVKIVISPYQQVPVGMVAKIERVIIGHFRTRKKQKPHPNLDLFVLSGPSHKNFRAHEIRPVTP